MLKIASVFAEIMKILLNVLFPERAAWNQSLIYSRPDPRF